MNVSFDEPIQKTVKVKENVHEKPTMNVISKPSANQRNREESSQPVAAVKPIQEQPVKSSKGGNVAKLAAS